MNNELSTLIDLLNVRLFVFFEDDFTFIGTPEMVLSDLQFIGDKHLNCFLEELVLKGYNELSDIIGKFYNEFSSKANKEGKSKFRFARGKIERFIFDKEEDNDDYRICREIYKEYSNTIIRYFTKVNEIEYQISDRKLEEIFIKYGIGISTEFPTPYDVIEKEMRKISSESIFRIYKGYSEADKSSIKADIEKAFNMEKEFCICFVDNNIQGEKKADIIVKFLEESFNEKSVSSIVLSTRPESEYSGPPENYLVPFVSKNDDILNKSAEKLALCTYGVLFRRLKNVNELSINKAFKLALTSEENIKMLIMKSKAEGITEFEAISNWFDLVMEKVFSDGIINDENDFSSIVKITQFLVDHNFTNNISTDPKYYEELKELNTYEIFDGSISSQYQPPAPGDVFAAEGKYYVLVGQDCDFMVRGNSISRKAKNAELLEAEFKNKNLTEKIDCSDKEKIVINYFKNEHSEIGVLEVCLGGYEVCDFNILDMCTFNKSGDCKISIKDSLSPEISFQVSETWRLLYESIQKRLEAISNIKQAIKDKGIEDVVLTQDRFSLFKYNANEDVINYPLKRICRLKGDFKHFLIKKYWDYKGRIGYNTLKVTNVEPLDLKRISLGYPGKCEESDFSMKGFFNRLSAYSDSEPLTSFPWILDLKSLIDRINEKFGRMYVLNNYNLTLVDERFQDDKTNIIIEKMLFCGNKYGIKITIPYIIQKEDKQYLLCKDTATIAEILCVKEDFLSEDFQVNYIISGDRLQIFDENNKLIKLNVKDVLRKGLRIQNFGIDINLDREKGIIYFSQRPILEEAMASSEK